MIFYRVESLLKKILYWQIIFLKQNYNLLMISYKGSFLLKSAESTNKDQVDINLLLKSLPQE
jgi:hypothetical protein